MNHCWLQWVGLQAVAWIFAMSFGANGFAQLDNEPSTNTVLAQNVNIRDVCIVADEENDCYYMFGYYRFHDRPEVYYYIGKNLNEWKGPFSCFKPSADYPAARQGWAPEVHAYRDDYYLLTSFEPVGRRRGTYALKAQRPQGPYTAMNDQPLTPAEMTCLDGTLWVDANQKPWLVFTHEWVDTGVGEMWLAELKEDLSATVGEPTRLFRATDVPWSSNMPWEVKVGSEHQNRVVEGASVMRMPSGRLWMIYAGMYEDHEVSSIDPLTQKVVHPFYYVNGAAWSESGQITGPWVHLEKPLDIQDGAHAMFFKDFEGRIVVSYHSPNTSGQERPVFRAITEKDGRLILID